MTTLTDDQETRLKALTAETLGVDVEEITDDSSAQTIAAWNSFNHLTLMAAVEETFGCTFSMSEMAGVARYADLRRLVADHLP